MSTVFEQVRNHYRLWDQEKEMPDALAARLKLLKPFDKGDMGSVLGALKTDVVPVEVYKVIKDNIPQKFLQTADTNWIKNHIKHYEKTQHRPSSPKFTQHVVVGVINDFNVLNITNDIAQKFVLSELFRLSQANQWAKKQKLSSDAIEYPLDDVFAATKNWQSDFFHKHINQQIVIIKNIERKLNFLNDTPKPKIPSTLPNSLASALNYIEYLHTQMSDEQAARLTHSLQNIQSYKSTPKRALSNIERYHVAEIDAAAIRYALRDISSKKSGSMRKM